MAGNLREQGNASHALKKSVYKMVHDSNLARFYGFGNPPRCLIENVTQESPCLILKK
jgi:hypothetical protein